MCAHLPPSPRQSPEVAPLATAPARPAGRTRPAVAVRALLPLAILLWTAAAAGQDGDKPPGGSSPREDLQQLRAVLGHRPPPPASERRRLLAEFLERHEAQHESAPALRVRLWLGREHLRAHEPEAALPHFEAVAAAAAGRLPELRANALFGCYHALRLQGRRDEARPLLDEILSRHAGTPVAFCARLTLAHLDRRAAPAVGDPLPDLLWGRALDGEPVAAPAGAPRLLVFWSMDHQPSVRRLQQLADAWRRAGQADRELVAFALEPSAQALQRFVAARDWPFAVLPSASGYLGADWLELDVTMVPAVLLVGADGRIVARDVPPDRLGALLGAM